MTRQCTVPGCLAQVAGWSYLCRAHKARKARHGHPLQGSITLPRIRPYLRLVDQARKRNPEARIWALLASGWESLVADARAQVQAAEDGQPYQRQALVRARQLVAVAESAAPEAVVNHALAMVWLWREEPRAFASDDAFRAQVARRIRLLAPRLSKGTYWNDKLQRVSTVVQELPPKVALGLGQQLIELFGPAGIRLAQLERERVPPEEAARRRLREALSELQ